MRRKGKVSEDLLLTYTFSSLATAKTKGSCTPTPGRHLSPVVRSESVPLESQRGEEGDEGKRSGNRSTPGSPRLGEDRAAWLMRCPELCT